LPTKTAPAGRAATVELVTAILEGYAEKAVFRGFSAHPKRGGKAQYKMIWHYDRAFELSLDVAAKTLRFPAILPGVPQRSAMYRDLRAFLKTRQSAETPEHRRVNPSRARLVVKNKRGIVSLALASKDGDFDYAARKIVQIVHEIFMVFLLDGPYYEYLVDHLGLDPDRY
jgi:hypothetical protein